MKLFSIFVATLFSYSIVFGQSPLRTTIQRSPKATVKQYSDLGEQGKLLTNNGWYEASRLFVHPQLPTRDASVAVIDEDGILHEKRIDEDHEEIEEPYELLGTIDATLRYIPATNSLYANSLLYRLVRTNTYSELSFDGKSHEVAGKPEWRIENSQSRWTNVKGAIQYVSEMHNKTEDLQIRRNAEATLEELRKLQRQTLQK